MSQTFFAAAHGDYSFVPGKLVTLSATLAEAITSVKKHDARKSLHSPEPDFSLSLSLQVHKWGSRVVTQAGLQAFGFPRAAEVDLYSKAEC